MTGTGQAPPPPVPLLGGILHPCQARTPGKTLLSVGITADCDKLELPQGGAPGPTAVSSVSLSPPQHPHRLHTPPPRLLRP